jgi:hypothetical protein
MHSKAKIKIVDNNMLREKLYDWFDKCDQVIIAQWAINLAVHISSICEIDHESNSTIIAGFEINKKWQNGNLRMFDVRQAGFKVHEIAKNEKDLLRQTAYRVVGQAIGTGHMKEHGMVASDYTIKCINIKYVNSNLKIDEERNWQISTIIELFDSLNKENTPEYYPYLVTVDNVRLLSEPNRKSQTIMYLTKSQRIELKSPDSIATYSKAETISDWVQIETQTKKIGWCEKKYISTISI